MAAALLEQDQRRHAAALDRCSRIRSSRSCCTRALGDAWVRDLDELRGLERFVDDAAFRDRWAAIKRANKEELAARDRDAADTPLDPDSLFDVQVKRIHEYKRQHLNILHVVALYHRLKSGTDADRRRAPSSSAARPRPGITSRS